MTRFPSIGRTLATALILVCTLAAPQPSRALADGASTPPKFRLPTDAAPQRYSLDLVVIPDQDTFTGAVDIDLSFNQATPVLWLNAEKLEVKEASLLVGGSVVSAKVIATPKDYVGFSFGRPVGPGPAKLHVSYQGEINRKDMEGIFQVKDGDTWYVYSQFESIAARRAFPCFDEPGYKVPWQLTLHVRNEHVALSNTPILSETVGSDGMKTVRFAETKPLPSYLIALTVGTLDLVDAGTAGKKNTRIRIVVPHGRSAEARYAVESTPAILSLLENYFGMPYPYEKLDEVVVPLSGIGMEHPGLVTYGAEGILWKPELDTFQRQRSYATEAAHELAHQWFGDLVTAAWWDDTWLNEGFASWMETKIVNQYHPEWKMTVSELNHYQGAMDSDSLVNARRVRQPIESNNDIANAFDDIAYNKGAALLTMFESYMGPDKFQEGIRRYLVKYSWKNATSTEFLAALGGQSRSIAAAFSSFLEQPGVPLITIRQECDGRPPRFDVSQQRFLPIGSQASAGQTWQVPICIRYSAGGDEVRECTLLTEKSTQLTLSKATGCPGWVIANADSAGYYRTLYAGDMLSAVLKDNAKALDLPERVTLIGDIAALTKAAQMPLGAALALVPQLVKDPNQQVVTKTMEITTGLQDKLVPEDLLPKYRRYLSDLYGGRARQLGWKAKPGDDEDTRILRPRIVGVVANQAEDPELIEQAKKLAAQWLDDRRAVDPDMVDVVLSTAARHGDRALFDHLRGEARKEKDEQARRALLAAIGSFPDPDIVKTALPIVLTDEFDNRESLSILFAASQSGKTRDLAYKFAKDNFDALVARMSTNVGVFLPIVAGGYCDNEHRADVEAFFKDRSTARTGGPRRLAQTVEVIGLCTAYRNAQQPGVVAFLQQY